jgi:hypothetical protein
VQERTAISFSNFFETSSPNLLASDSFVFQESTTPVHSFATSSATLRRGAPRLDSYPELMISRKEIWFWSDRMSLSFSDSGALGGREGRDLSSSCRAQREK